MKHFALICWRISYPILIYLLLFDLLALSGISPGIPRIALSAGLCILILGPLYRRERMAGLPIAYPKIIALSAVFCMLGNLLILWLQLNSPGYEQTEAVLYGATFPARLLVVGFLAPFAEELVFRGLVYGRLRREIRVWQASLLSALLFAGFHGNIVQGIYAFWGGLLMAWSYETYHSIKAPYCIHAVSNLLSILFSALAQTAG